MKLLESTRDEKVKIRKFMFNRIMSKYCSGVLEDTGMREMLLKMDDYSLENEFKTLYDLKTENSYFGA